MESIIAKVMELQNKENTNIPLYEKQLRDAESGIQNMLNAIQAGILTSSTKERLEQLEETKRELEARIAEEKLAKPKVTEEFIRFWLLRFRKLDMSLKDQRQALVDTFINAIYLYDDKVLITFNYKEGTQTIPFEKVEESKAKGNGSDFDCVTAPQGRQLLIAVFFALYDILGQFTRNYTQTVKRAADNKLRLNTKHRKSARCSACFVVCGFQRGFPFGTRLCSQSVVCYTLCRRCRENTVAAGEGKGV